MSTSNIPRISIVTPSFNQVEFLEETILSVINQDYPDLEYIIIDGGSIDGSLEIIKKYESRITYWESKKDLGQSDAINKGLKKITGDIVGIINSDDKYLNVFNLIPKLFQSANTKWIAGNILYINKEGKILKRKKPLFSPFILKYGTSSIYQPGVFIRTDILEKTGLLDISFHAIMDQEWFCRIAEFSAPKIFDIDLALFRLHQRSKSSSSRKSFHYTQYINEKKILAERYFPNFRLGFQNFTELHLFILEQIARILKSYKRIFIQRERIE